MSKQDKNREERLPIVSEYYKKCYTLRAIAQKVEEVTGKHYPHTTIDNDIKFLLKNWRQKEISDINDRITSEIERSEYAVTELWGEWEKSKELSKDGIAFGNPAYIAEIRKNLEEIRKILGLYSPERKEVNLNTYEITFE